MLDSIAALNLSRTVTDIELLACSLEYEQLKQEQIARIGARDNFLYAMLVGLGAVGAIVLQEPQRWVALLSTPLFAAVLALLYVANDERVTEISQYIRSELAPRLAVRHGNNTHTMFSWESYRLQLPDRDDRKVREAVTLQAVFLLPSAIALVVTIYLAPADAAVDTALLVFFCATVFPTRRLVRSLRTA